MTAPGTIPPPPVNPDDPGLPAAIRAAAAAEIARAGRLTNMKAVLLHSLPAFRVFAAVLPLKDRLRAALGARAVDVYSHAISEGTGCLLCSLYFVRALRGHGVDPADFAPTPDEALLTELGHHLAAVRGEGPPPPAVAALAARHGAQVAVEAVAYGAAMVATNLLNTALGIPIDDDLAPFRAAATDAA